MFNFIKNALTGKPKLTVPYSKGLPLTDHQQFGTGEERQWIGVDLDGTLAIAEPWKGFEHIGKPVPNMLKRVKIWLEMGYNVKIVTARAAQPEEAIPPIKQWLKANGLPDLEVTNGKDMDMIELWDDRCVQVIANTGNPVTPMERNARR